MDIATITKSAGRNTRRKRLGRGTGSGHGKTSGRGHKGYKARAGGGPRRLTEGGQMAIFRRIPKRGFNNANFRTEVAIVNVGALNKTFKDGAHVTKEALAEAGLVRRADMVVKILGNGDLERRLTVEVDRFSDTAKEKITAAGGTAQSLGG
jgi:large subunit ribosomal protein L15